MRFLPTEARSVLSQHANLTPMMLGEAADKAWTSLCRSGAVPLKVNAASTTKLCKWHKRWGDKARRYKKLCTRFQEFSTSQSQKTRQANEVGLDAEEGWSLSQDLPKKRVGRSPCATVNALFRPASLGLVHDRITGFPCLLDSGSQVSLWPAPRNRSECLNPELNLMAANWQPIPAFHVHTRKINIDGFDYISPFISAKVSRPILGIDFLKKHKMCLDFSKNLLSHSGVQTVFEHATGQSSKIHLVQGTMQGILRVLDRFP